MIDEDQVSLNLVFIYGNSLHGHVLPEITVLHVKFYSVTNSRTIRMHFNSHSELNVCFELING